MVEIKSEAIKSVVKSVVKRYGVLAALNAKLSPSNSENIRKKGDLSREMARLYAREISPRVDELLDMPLEAATDADSAGTLFGSLISQQALELFSYELLPLSMITTDFEDTPGLFNQPQITRVVIVPAVQEYDNTIGVDNRPKGWDTVSVAQTLDVSVTLDKHVGVPIVFGADTLSSTPRRLFEEQAPAAGYALSKYFIDKVYALITPANFNAYAAVVAGTVPNAYATYPVGLADFARSKLTAIGTILTQNQVPFNNRFCLLSTGYYGQLSNDPSLVTFYAAQRAPEMVSDAMLPKLSRFTPIEAPNLPTTNNLVGFAGHRASLVVKTRLPADYSKALPNSSYGTISTITEAKTGLSLLQTQYVNHTQGFAELRLAVMVGASVGDKRGGLCITSA